MELHQEIENALIKIKFVEKYTNISEESIIKYNETATKVNKVEPQQIIQLLEGLGIHAEFIKKERFFKTTDIRNKNYLFRMHFAFNYDFVECIWVVQKNNNMLLGSPLGVLPRLLVSPDFRIKPPKYSNYEDIQVIVKQLLNLFNEFQCALVDVEYV